MSSTREMSPAKRFFITRIFPLTIVIVGALTMYVGVENIVTARASMKWPTVEGKITYSSVEKESSRSQSGGSHRSITYRPKILYEYSVNDVKYTGYRVSYGAYATGDPSDADKITKKYPAGSVVPVYYMTENHQECVLEPGMAGLPWFFLGIGLIFGLVGIVLVVFVPKLVRQSQG